MTLLFLAAIRRLARFVVQPRSFREQNQSPTRFHVGQHASRFRAQVLPCRTRHPTLVLLYLLSLRPRLLQRIVRQAPARTVLRMFSLLRFANASWGYSPA